MYNHYTHSHYIHTQIYSILLYVNTYIVKQNCRKSSNNTRDRKKITRREREIKNQQLYFSYHMNSGYNVYIWEKGWLQKRFYKWGVVWEYHLLLYLENCRRRSLFRWALVTPYIRWIIFIFRNVKSQALHFLWKIHQNLLHKRIKVRLQQKRRVKA